MKNIKPIIIKYPSIKISIVSGTGISDTDILSFGVNVFFHIRQVNVPDNILKGGNPTLMQLYKMIRKRHKFPTQKCYYQNEKH